MINRPLALDQWASKDFSVTQTKRNNMKIGMANDTIKFKKSSLLITMMIVLKGKPNKMYFTLCRFYIFIT